MKQRSVKEEMIADFGHYLRENEKSRNTIDKYLRDVRKFKEYSLNKDVTRDTVLDYKKWLSDENYGINSINSMIASLNSFFVFAGWENLRIKTLKQQRRVYCPEDTELTKGEYFRLIETAKRNGDVRLCLVIQTICGTGIRVSELEFITVEAVMAGIATVSLKGKTRFVFIIKDLQKKLTEYAKESGIKKGPVFRTVRGRTLDRSNIWRSMKKLCADAGVDERKVYPHNLRHLFARTFYEMDKDITKLADILGHSNIETTRIYTISSGAEHRKCMENMGLVV